MSNNFPMVPLGKLLSKSQERVDIDPGKLYQQVTVRLWGKGVVLRGEVDGASIGSSKQFIVQANQFILSKIDARNGAFGLVPASLDGAIVSADFPVFTPNSQLVLPEFLEWLSKTHDFIELCKAASEGTTNRIRLKEGRFLAAKISLPPLEEQRRIVARIEELSIRIGEAQRLEAEVSLDAYKLLLGEYRRITRYAEQFPMKTVAPLVRRPVQVELAQDYHELGIRSFGKGTFHKPPLKGVDVGTKKLFKIAENDLLFNIVFAWEGAVAVAKPEDAGRVGSHRFLTCVPEQGIVTAPFLCFHFLTNEGLGQLMQASPGSAGRNRTLGIQALEEIKVPVPPIEEQLHFDKLQTKSGQIKETHSKASAELDALLPSILGQAFKGEL